MSPPCIVVVVSPHDRSRLVLFYRIFILLEQVGIIRDLIECSYRSMRASRSVPDAPAPHLLLEWPGLRRTLLTFVIELMAAPLSPRDDFRLCRSANLEKE